MEISLSLHILLLLFLVPVIVIAYLLRVYAKTKKTLQILQQSSSIIEEDGQSTTPDDKTDYPNELALAASEKRFKTLVDSLNDLLYILDNKLNMVGLYGKGADKYMVGTDLQENYSFENLLTIQEVSEGNRKALEGEKSSFIWSGDLDGDKRQLNIQISPVPGEGEQVNGVVGIIEDQTEEVKNLENLFQLASIIELAHEMIFITDRVGNIDYINPAYEKNTGYKLEQLIGQPIPLSKTHPEEYESIQSSITNQTSWRGRVSLQDENGENHFADVSITPIFDKENELINYVGICRDISYTVNLESEYNHLQRIMTINTLAAGIAHDLNNILSGLTGHFELVTLKNGEGECFESHLDTIRRSLKKASNLLTPLLGFARTSMMDKSKFDIMNIIKESVELSKRSRRKNVLFEIEEDEKEIWVFADETQVSQVLLNLLVNAVDASDDGGLVTIGCHYEVDEQHQNDSVTIVVEDKGTGIEADLTDHIFEPFYTTKDMGDGTGLGLSTVKRIVESNGGRIQVESNVGVGTKFIVKLPLKNQDMDIEDTNTNELGTKSDKTIVLAEYDDVFRTALSELLIRRGYTVLQADSCSKLQQITHQMADQIDVIVFNLFRPIKAGISTIREVRLLYPELPIMITGGNVHQEEVEEIKALGVNEFLAKPFTSKILSEKIENIVTESHNNNEV